MNHNLYASCLARTTTTIEGDTMHRSVRLRGIAAAFGAALAVCTAPANAVTLVSVAAGFAGTTNRNCFGDANSFGIEITYVAEPFGCQRQGIAEFDLTGIAAPAVTSAILTLYDGQAGNSEGRLWPVDVYGYAGDGQVTGSDLGAGIYFTSAIWNRDAIDADRFAIDVTEVVNSLLAGNAEFAGFNLRPPEFSIGGVTFTIFTFFDGGGGDRPPTLELTPVPVPAALLLFGSGLAGLGFLVRRRAVWS